MALRRRKRAAQIKIFSWVNCAMCAARVASLRKLPWFHNSVAPPANRFTNAKIAKSHLIILSAFDSRSERCYARFFERCYARSALRKVLYKVLRKVRFAEGASQVE